MIWEEHIVNPLLDPHDTKRDNPLLIEDNPLMKGRVDMGIIIRDQLGVPSTRPLGTCIWNAADDGADKDPNHGVWVQHYTILMNSILPIVAIGVGVCRIGRTIYPWSPVHEKAGPVT